MKVEIVLVLFAMVLTNYNARAISDDDLQKILKILEAALKYLASKVHIHPDTGLNIYQFVDKYNYTLEAHNITTEDGYILTLHRITGKKSNITENYEGTVKNGAPRPVVLLSHCLACSSMAWLFQGPSTSLGFLLADAGYDVWMPNVRGSDYSMKHENLTSAKASFWDFSFHEKGFYDMAASIDYVINTTEVEKITYVGHSQGTTEGLVLTSSRPEYNKKLNLMVMMSPIVYLNHTISPLALFVEKYIGIIKLGLNILGIHGIPHLKLISILGDVFCNDSSSLQGLCLMFMDLFAGFDYAQVDTSVLTVFLGNIPNGMSIKDVEHYTQEMKSGSFRQYDYGNAIANFLHYRSLKPPAYNISKVTVPLAVYYGKNDFLAGVEDVERFLAESKAKTVDKYLLDYEYFNHLDFVIAKDIKSLLYDRVIGVIRQNNPLPAN